MPPALTMWTLQIISHAYFSLDGWKTTCMWPRWVDYINTKTISNMFVEILVFASYRIMKGGCKTGFRHVEPTEYKPRLLLVSGRRKNVSVVEVGDDSCQSN